MAAHRRRFPLVGGVGVSPVRSELFRRMWARGWRISASGTGAGGSAGLCDLSRRRLPQASCRRRPVRRRCFGGRRRLIGGRGLVTFAGSFASLIAGRSTRRAWRKHGQRRTGTRAKGTSGAGAPVINRLASNSRAARSKARRAQPKMRSDIDNIRSLRTGKRKPGSRLRDSAEAGERDAAATLVEAI